MNSYILSVTAAAVGAGAILMLSPEKPGIKKYLNFLVSLCLLCTMLLPLGDAIGEIPSLIESIPAVGEVYVETEISPAEYLVCALKDELSLAAQRDMYAKFGIDAKVECGIEYNEEKREARLYEMTVAISDAGKWAVSDIEKYLGDLYGCEVCAERNGVKR